MNSPIGADGLQHDGLQLSVVVVALERGEWGGGVGDALRKCLASLASQEGEVAAEVIVPCDERLAGAGVMKALSGVKVVRLAGQRTPAELRSFGVRSARGNIVALTEDHCTAASDWFSQILEAHTLRRAAIGGVVEKALGGAALEWALYFSDYGRFMSPVRDGPARYITDCNVSYERSMLENVRTVWLEEFHETEVHDALVRRGEILWLSPRIIVHSRRVLPYAVAMRDRYLFGRLFASGRVAGAGPVKRALYAGSCVALPAVLLGRMAANILHKRRHIAQWLRAFPAATILVAAWTCGEFTGYLTGRPSRELRPKPTQGSNASGKKLVGSDA
ncbi:MAG: glycosyltransferase family 2 protein [Gemmatimonadaceae bacterium]